MNIISQSFGPGVITPGNPISLNFLSLSKITVAVTPISTGAFTVQATLDQIFDQAAADYVPVGAAAWFTIVGAPTAAAGYVTFDGPWRAVRLNPTANATGIVFQVGQGDSGRY